MQAEEETTWSAYNLLSGKQRRVSFQQKQRKQAKKPNLSYTHLCFSPNLTIYLAMRVDNKHVLSTFCVPGTVPNARATDYVSVLNKLYSIG